MGFGSMSSLWFGLALPAIVLLYLLKRKYIDTPVSSHLLWNRVLKELEANRPWQRLRSRLLMLVQLLAAALVVLALMNPWVTADRYTRTHVVVVFDRSASMSAEASSAADESSMSRLDTAKARLLDWIDEAGEGSAITLLVMGEQPEVVLTKETDKQAIRTAMERIKPDYGQTAYYEALSLASALTRAEPESEIRVFTDGQMPESKAGLSFAVPVTVDQDGAPAGNAAVSQFGVKRSGHIEGTAAAVAAFKSWGKEPIELEVSLYAEGKLAEVRRLSMEPGTPASLSFDGLPFAEWYKLEAVAAGDPLAVDNVSYAFLEGTRPKRVLYVGEGNLFLQKALQLAGAEITRLAPDGVEAWASSYREADGPDALIIDAALPSSATGDAWSNILDTKPVMWIRSGYEGTEQTAAARSYEVEEHPVTRYLTFGDTHIAGMLEPTEGTIDGKTIVSAGGAPLVIAGTEDGQPRLWLTFALQHTDWPLRSEFPVFVHHAVEWLTSAQGGSLGRAVAGVQTEIAFAPLAVAARWVSESGEETIVEAASVEGRPAAMQTVPSQPGLYRLIESDEGGQTVQSRWLGVMSDPRESASVTAELSFDAAVDNSAATDTAAEPQPDQSSPLWRWAILLVLAVVVWEWGVYRRGTSI
jgi:hypothetical protein